jgi:hypothetical protein
VIEGMHRDTVRLLGGSVFICVALSLLYWPVVALPFANALYACGLWPRMTVEDVLYTMQRDKMRVSQCSVGTNGWEFICQVPGRPGIRQFHDKLGVQGGPFGIAVTVELPPGPAPSWESVRDRHSPNR